MFVSSNNLFDCGCHFLQFWNDASKFIWYDLDENQIWPINRFRETMIIKIALAKKSVVIIYFRWYLFFFVFNFIFAWAGLWCIASTFRVSLRTRNRISGSSEITFYVM